MAEGYGAQCGFARPVSSVAVEGYYRDTSTRTTTSTTSFRQSLRCTGYRPIRDAAIEAFLSRKQPSDEAQIKAEIGKAEMGNSQSLLTSAATKIYLPTAEKTRTAKLGAAEYEFASEKFLAQPHCANCLSC